MSRLDAESFSIPKPPARTPVEAPAAERFVGAVESADRASRLSVDLPRKTLRALKRRALERDVTVREYVIGLLAKDGL